MFARLGKEYLPGITPRHRGKVRDTYDPLTAPGKFLVVATDRISVFDFVLNAEVKDKGEILTAMNIFWRQQLKGFKHDLVAYGAGIDEYLPDEYRGNKELQARSIIVRQEKMLPVECIVRGYLTGSGWSSYQKTQIVCGHKLEPGLCDGDMLPQPLFTPTTKAEVGHDEHMDFRSVDDRYGQGVGIICITAYQEACKIAMKRNIIIADTKFEVAMRGDELVFADEMLTPDSSRFLDMNDWVYCREHGGSPRPFDKQFVRNHMKELGVDKLDNSNPEHYAQVQAMKVPSEILAQTTRLYHEIFERLTGMTLTSFQRQVMGIAA